MHQALHDCWVVRRESTWRGVGLRLVGSVGIGWWTFGELALAICSRRRRF